jgi:hypothetical protein
MAGQQPSTPFQPDMVATNHAGTISENSGNCRPAIWLNAISSMPETFANVMIGVPNAPNATGEVFANKAKPAAYSGENPRPIINAAEMATGVPKPAAPSTNVPNENAINSACIRRSGEMAATERLTTSNWPERTVRWNRNTAASTIQPIGSSPKQAP